VKFKYQVRSFKTPFCRALYSTAAFAFINFIASGHCTDGTTETTCLNLVLAVAAVHLAAAFYLATQASWDHPKVILHHSKYITL
jgi:hypothetical protein